MPALFAVTRLTRLARARLVLLEGHLLEGTLLVGQPTELEQAGERRPVQVLGVLGGLPGSPADKEALAGPALLQVTLGAQGLTAWALSPGACLRQA